MKRKSAASKWLVYFLAFLMIGSSLGLMALGSQRNRDNKEDTNVVVDNGQDKKDNKEVEDNENQADDFNVDELNKKVSANMKKDKDVLAASANYRDGEIIATISFTYDADKDDAIKVAESYLEKLKSEAKDKNITVQVWQNGENLKTLQ